MSADIYSDLYRDLTTNPDFVNKVCKVLHNIELADKSGNIAEMKQHVQELLMVCEFNASLLVPYFFPRFPEFEPMTLWSRPHAFSMMGLTLLGSLTVQASRQIGKCLEKDSKITIKDSSGERDMTIESLFEEAKKSA